MTAIPTPRTTQTVRDLRAAVRRLDVPDPAQARHTAVVLAIVIAIFVVGLGFAAAAFAN